MKNPSAIEALPHITRRGRRKGRQSENLRCSSDTRKLLREEFTSLLKTLLSESNDDWFAGCAKNLSFILKMIRHQPSEDLLTIFCRVLCLRTKKRSVDRHVWWFSETVSAGFVLCWSTEKVKTDCRLCPCQSDTHHSILSLLLNLSSAPTRSDYEEGSRELEKRKWYDKTDLLNQRTCVLLFGASNFLSFQETLYQLTGESYFRKGLKTISTSTRVANQMRWETFGLSGLGPAALTMWWRMLFLVCCPTWETVCQLSAISGFVWMKCYSDQGFDQGFIFIIFFCDSFVSAKCIE